MFGFEEWMAHLPVNPIAWFGTMITVMGFIRYCTKSVDGELDTGVRDEIALRLMDLNPRKAGAWVPDFVLVFDRFFGKQPWHTGFVLRSVLVSSVVFILCWFSLKSMGLRMDATWAPNTWPLSLGYISYNVIIDYFSLLETRLLLTTRLRYVWKLILDGGITLGICLIGIWVLKRFDQQDDILLALNLVNPSNPPTLGDIIEAIFNPSRINGPVYLCILLTTFTTSLWLWLHGLATLTIRISRGTVLLVQKLNIAVAPLRAVGVVINAYICVIGMLGYIAVYAIVALT